MVDSIGANLSPTGLDDTIVASSTVAPSAPDGATLPPPAGETSPYLTGATLGYLAVLMEGRELLTSTAKVAINATLRALPAPAVKQLARWLGMDPGSNSNTILSRAVDAVASSVEQVVAGFKAFGVDLTKIPQVINFELNGGPLFGPYDNNDNKVLGPVTALNLFTQIRVEELMKVFETTGDRNLREGLQRFLEHHLPGSTDKDRGLFSFVNPETRKPLPDLGDGKTDNPNAGVTFVPQDIRFAVTPIVTNGFNVKIDLDRDARVGLLFLSSINSGTFDSKITNIGNNTNDRINADLNVIYEVYKDIKTGKTYIGFGPVYFIGSQKRVGIGGNENLPKTTGIRPAGNLAAGVYFAVGLNRDGGGVALTRDGELVFNINYDKGGDPRYVKVPDSLRNVLLATGEEDLSDLATLPPEEPVEEFGDAIKQTLENNLDEDLVNFMSAAAEYGEFIYSGAVYLNEYGAPIVERGVDLSLLVKSLSVNPVLGALVGTQIIRGWKDAEFEQASDDFIDEFILAGGFEDPELTLEFYTGLIGSMIAIFDDKVTAGADSRGFLYDGTNIVLDAQLAGEFAELEDDVVSMVRFLDLALARGINSGRIKGGAAAVFRQLNAMVYSDDPFDRAVGSALLGDFRPNEALPFDFQIEMARNQFSFDFSDPDNLGDFDGSGKRPTTGDGKISGTYVGELNQVLGFFTLIAEAARLEGDEGNLPIDDRKTLFGIEDLFNVPSPYLVRDVSTYFLDSGGSAVDLYFDAVGYLQKLDAEKNSSYDEVSQRFQALSADYRLRLVDAFVNGLFVNPFDKDRLVGSYEQIRERFDLDFNKLPYIANEIIGRPVIVDYGDGREIIDYTIIESDLEVGYFGGGFSEDGVIITRSLDGGRFKIAKSDIRRVDAIAVKLLAAGIDANFGIALLEERMNVYKRVINGEDAKSDIKLAERHIAFGGGVSLTPEAYDLARSLRETPRFRSGWVRRFSPEQIYFEMNPDAVRLQLSSADNGIRIAAGEGVSLPTLDALVEFDPRAGLGDSYSDAGNNRIGSTPIADADRPEVSDPVVLGQVESYLDDLQRNLGLGFSSISERDDAAKAAVLNNPYLSTDDKNRILQERFVGNGLLIPRPRDALTGQAAVFNELAQGLVTVNDAQGFPVYSESEAVSLANTRIGIDNEADSYGEAVFGSLNTANGGAADRSVFNTVYADRLNARLQDLDAKVSAGIKVTPEDYEAAQRLSASEAFSVANGDLALSDLVPLTELAIGLDDPVIGGPDGAGSPVEGPSRAGFMGYTWSEIAGQADSALLVVDPGNEVAVVSIRTIRDLARAKAAEDDGVVGNAAFQYLLGFAGNLEDWFALISGGSSESVAALAGFTQFVAETGLAFNDGVEGNGARDGAAAFGRFLTQQGRTSGNKALLVSGAILEAGFGSSNPAAGISTLTGRLLQIFGGDNETLQVAGELISGAGTVINLFGNGTPGDGGAYAVSLGTNILSRVTGSPEIAQAGQIASGAYRLFSNTNPDLAAGLGVQLFRDVVNILSDGNVPKSFSMLIDAIGIFAASGPFGQALAAGGLAIDVILSLLNPYDQEIKRYGGPVDLDADGAGDDQTFLEIETYNYVFRNSKVQNEYRFELRSPNPDLLGRADYTLTQNADGSYQLRLTGTWNNPFPPEYISNQTDTETTVATLSAQQGQALLGATGGAATGSFTGSDTALVEAFKPWLDTQKPEFQGHNKSPFLLSFNDLNFDSAPDLVIRSTPGQGFDGGDGKVTIRLRNADGQDIQPPFTADTMEQAADIALVSLPLMEWAASNPGIAWDRGTDLKSLYDQAAAMGVLDGLRALRQLEVTSAALGTGAAEGGEGFAGVTQGLDAFVQTTALRAQLGITFDAGRYLAAQDVVDADGNVTNDLRAAFGTNDYALINHYLAHGNAEGRAIDASGTVLWRYQPPATNWTDQQALEYAASHFDLADWAWSGPFAGDGSSYNIGALKAHWTNHGRFEGRSADTYDLETYKTLRQDVVAAAEAFAEQQGNALWSNPGNGWQSFTLQDGRVLWRRRQSAGGIVAPGSAADGYQYRISNGPLTNARNATTVYNRTNGVSAPQAEALLASERSARGLSDPVDVFITEHFLTNGRFEMGLDTLEPQGLREGYTLVGPKTKTLGPGQAMISANERFVLYMTPQGGLERVDRLTRATIVMASGPAGSALYAQDDANGVLYAPDGRPVFDTSTYRRDGAVINPSNFLLGDDGNVILEQELTGEHLWSLYSGKVKEASLPPFSLAGLTAKGDQLSSTAGEGSVLRAGEYILSPDGSHALVMQVDGNLVSYRVADGAVVWNAGTQPRAAGGYAQVNPDGYFGVKDPTGRSRWDTETYRRDGAANRTFLVGIDNQGIVSVIDGQGGEEIWASNRGRIERADVNVANGLLDSDIDALSYIASHPDLMTAFGANAQAGRDHHVTYGIGERRQMTFDVDTYLGQREDVRTYYANLGMTAPEIRRAAVEHYINYGRFEMAGVKPPSTWTERDALTYLASYGDLIEAFGPDTAAAREHFRAYGFGENRNPVRFDAYTYLNQTRIDVRDHYMAQGLTGEALLEAATRHYITNGYYEAQGLTPPAPPVPASPAALAQQGWLAGYVDVGPSLTNGALLTGQMLVSASGRFVTVMQTDGNAVAYELNADGSMKRVLWATNTVGKATGGYLAMQGDGHLVLYDDDGSVEWKSRSYNSAINRPFTLIMQDDGNLVTYDSLNGQATWSILTGRIIAKPQANAA